MIALCLLLHIGPLLNVRKKSLKFIIAAGSHTGRQDFVFLALIICFCHLEGAAADREDC